LGCTTLPNPLDRPALSLLSKATLLIDIVEIRRRM
jgi:hypothetical protein